MNLTDALLPGDLLLFAYFPWLLTLSQALREINLDTLTPKQALDLLYHLKSLDVTCTAGAT